VFLLLILVTLFVLYGIVEYRRHCRYRDSIPVRVQVNGTRGKSSVTRLIAAGLRAGGMKVIAKTTGTMPRFILSDREEEPIPRPGKPNIIENVRIVRRAAQMKPQAIVFECMALVPQYQWVDAHRLLRPTHGVITNARADHLDVMGPTVRDVAQALANTVPEKARFFTAEQELLPIFADRAKRLHTVVNATRADSVSDEEMKGFSYVEHKENAALALAVCTALGVERRTALAGMHRALPDPGAMRIFALTQAGKQLELVNTLAANDPDSIARLWQMTRDRRPERIVLVNCRSDRHDRSRQLAELCARHFSADYFVATGGMTSVFVRAALGHGLPAAKVVNMGDNWPPARVLAGIWKLVREDALVFATGNIVGYGGMLIDFIASSGGEIAY
jgi:poly-gamma-glutamate synthase PgsB/CapB